MSSRSECLSCCFFMHSFGSKRVGGQFQPSQRQSFFTILCRFMCTEPLHYAICYLIYLLNFLLLLVQENNNNKNRQACDCTWCSRCKGQGSWVNKAASPHRAKGCHHQNLHFYATWSAMLIQSHIGTWPNNIWSPRRRDFSNMILENVNWCTEEWDKPLDIAELGSWALKALLGTSSKNR